MKRILRWSRRCWHDNKSPWSLPPDELGAMRVVGSPHGSVFLLKTRQNDKHMTDLGKVRETPSFIFHLSTLFHSTSKKDSWTMTTFFLGRESLCRFTYLAVTQIEQSEMKWCGQCLGTAFNRAFYISLSDYSGQNMRFSGDVSSFWISKHARLPRWSPGWR